MIAYDPENEETPSSLYEASDNDSDIKDQYESYKYSDRNKCWSVTILKSKVKYLE